MSKLQLACDLVDMETLRELIPQLKGYVDIFEMGTPFCLRYGSEGVAQIHKEFPDITLLADTKIFDGGEVETKMYTDIGAKYVTVMARTNDATIANCAKACHESGAQCMVDLICEADLAKRVPELEALGADVLAVHVAVDYYTKFGTTPLSSLAELSGLVKTAKTAVAGGVTLDTVKDYLAHDPEIIIVGSGILYHNDPVEKARQFSQIIRG